MEVAEVAVSCILSKMFFLAMQFIQKKYPMARQSKINRRLAACRKRIRQYKRFRSQRRKLFETCLKQSNTLEYKLCKTLSKNWWDSIVLHRFETSDWHALQKLTQVHHRLVSTLEIHNTNLGSTRANPA